VYNDGQLPDSEDSPAVMGSARNRTPESVSRPLKISVRTAIGGHGSFLNVGPGEARLPRAPAPKSQTPTRVAALFGDLGFPALTESARFCHSPQTLSSFCSRSAGDPWT
jgi:hypothetical protein